MIQCYSTTHDRIFLSWDEYYPDNKAIETKYENAEFNSQTLQPNEGDAYFRNCFFHDIRATNGGAIFYSKTGSCILVEHCILSNCTSSGLTGGIRIVWGNNTIVHTCGEQCNAGVNDAFCAITQDKERMINNFIDSSVSNCHAEERYTMYFRFGPVRVNTVNLSFNRAKTISTISCEPSKPFSQETQLATLLTYCSFSNNTASGSNDISFNNENNRECFHKVANTNIIDNKGKATVYIIGKLISSTHASFQMAILVSVLIARLQQSH